MGLLGANCLHIQFYRAPRVPACTVWGFRVAAASCHAPSACSAGIAPDPAIRSTQDAAWEPTRELRCLVRALIAGLQAAIAAVAVPMAERTYREREVKDDGVPDEPSCSGRQKMEGGLGEHSPAHLPEVLHLLPLEVLALTAVLRAPRIACRLATGVLRVLCRPATSAGAPLERGGCAGAACVWLQQDQGLPAGWQRAVARVGRQAAGCGGAGEQRGAHHGFAGPPAGRDPGLAAATWCSRNAHTGGALCQLGAGRLGLLGHP